MSWIIGNQTIRNDAPDANKAIKELEGFLDEEQARYWLIQFLKHNISFAAQVLLGVQLYPFQHITINTFERTDYSMYIAGRGLSKTWSTAVFAALHGLFNQGAKIGIMAPSFRQSKIILEKLEDILREPEAELYRQCIESKKGDVITKGADQWSLQVGKTTIKAIPLGDGSKIRGQRFNCILIDEFLAMPKTIHQEVIMPFISTVQNPHERDAVKAAEDELIKQGKMKEEDRYIWASNKIIAFSSASYKFEYLYEVYQLFEKLISGNLSEEDEKDDIIKLEKSTNASRSILHFSHEVASNYSLYDQNAVEQARASSSEAQFAREWEGQFTDDSCGFYSMKKMIDCAIPDGQEPSVELFGSKGAKYILAIDPSWSKEDSSDNFAMHVLKLNEESKTATIVHCYAVPGRDVKDHIKYFEYVWDNFNVVLIVGDYNGSVQFLDAINESKVFKDKGISFNSIDGIKFTSPEQYNDDLREFKKQYNRESNTIWYMKTSTGWLRWGNELLQISFDKKAILFASRSQKSEVKDFSGDKYSKIPVNHPDFLFYPDVDKKIYPVGNQRGMLLSLIDRQSDLLEMTRNECALIEVKSNPAGGQTFDLPQNLRRQRSAKKARKDSYSALLFGNFGVKMYYDQVDVEVKKVDAFFMPILI